MIEEITITSKSGRGSVNMKTRDYEGYWLGLVDWGQVQGQHQTYNFYNQVGENIVSTTVGGRPLSIPGWVIAPQGQTLRERCDFLNSFISPVEDYTLEYEDKRLDFRPDSSIKYGRPRQENNRFKRAFLIQATCAYPLFRQEQDTAVPFDQSGKLFRFPQGFGAEGPVVFGTINRTYSTEIINTGGFAAGFVAKIKFTGQVENPRIKSLTTGGMVGLRRTFVRGERLEICTLPGSKSITLFTQGGERENLMKSRDFRTSWDLMMIRPGRNILALDCEDLDQRGSMDVTIFYTPLYLEVE